MYRILSFLKRLVICWSIGFGLWVFFRPFDIQTDVCNSASFGIMPKDDIALEKWLNNYPGISQVEVRRTGTKLVIYFYQLNEDQSIVYNIFGLNDQKPNLNAQAAIFGYQKPYSKFELCTSRGWYDDPSSYP
jgi:hypothetical protein